MIDPTTAEALRYVYAALAVLVCAGFAMTLVLRWDVLHPGERLLRTGLIAEHMVIIYGSYTAIDLDYPPTLVGVGMTVALITTVGGFALWLGDLLLHGDHGPVRLTDHARPHEGDDPR